MTETELLAATQSADTSADASNEKDSSSAQTHDDVHTANASKRPSRFVRLRPIRNLDFDVI